MAFMFVVLFPLLYILILVATIYLGVKIKSMLFGKDLTVMMLKKKIISQLAHVFLYSYFTVVYSWKAIKYIQAVQGNKDIDDGIYIRDPPVWLLIQKVIFACSGFIMPLVRFNDPMIK